MGELKSAGLVKEEKQSATRISLTITLEIATNRLTLGGPVDLFRNRLYTLGLLETAKVAALELNAKIMAEDAKNVPV